MKPRLLIVDDEPDILDFLERVFRTDFEVVRASGGHDALKLLESGPVDVLITDQKMPRMTGLELLEAIRDRFPDMIRAPTCPRSRRRWRRWASTSTW